MKKFIYFIPILVILLAPAACTLDKIKGDRAAESALIDVVITMPEDFEEYGLEGYTIEFRNNNIGFRYLRQTNANGAVAQELEFGSYQVMVKGEITTPGGKAAVSGQVQIIFDAAFDRSKPLVIDASVNMLSPIIISEFYGTGSTNALGVNFNRDRYIIIYNNSPDVQYLDGVGFGFHQTANSIANPVNYTNADGTPWDSIPHGWGFIIPGSGTDHPMQPGGEAIFVLNAIDHTLTANAGPLFVNLARENVWALYRPDPPSATTLQDAPQSPSNTAFSYLEGQGTMVALSNTSPALFIYKFEGLSATLDTYEKVALDYVKDGAVAGRSGGHVQFSPPGLTSLRVIKIPKEWVLDAVEVRQAGTFYKRFPASLEAGSVFCPPSYSGVTLRRKVNEVLSAEYGFTVYQDTNNSEDDWISLESIPEADFVLHRPTLLER